MAKTYKNDHRYLVAHLMADVRTDQTFTDWPRHITILPWFMARHHDAMSGFMHRIEKMEACRVHLAGVELGTLALYGENNSTPVRRIDGDGAIVLGMMHAFFLDEFAGRVINTDYSGYKFRPHVSLVGSDSDVPETFNVDSLCLIRRDDGDEKTIVAAERMS